MTTPPPPPPPAEELRLIDAELRSLDGRRAQLLARRDRLVGVLWAANAPAAPPAPRGRPPSPGRATGSDASGPGVQNVLLLLGGLLLGISSLVFTVVAWGSLGIGGRSLVLGVLTTVVLASPVPLLRRGLRATAESLAGLGMTLTVLDAYALHRVALSDVPVAVYAAAACAVLAALWAGYGWLFRELRGPWPAAAAVAQLVLPLWASDAGGPLEVFVAALLATATVGAAAALSPLPSSVRWTAGVGACLAGAAALPLALWLSLSASGAGAVVVAALLMAFAAAICAVVAWRLRDGAAAVAPAVLAGVLAVAASGGAVRSAVPWEWAVPGYLACALLLLLGVARTPLPAVLRRGAAWAVAGMQGAGLLWALPLPVAALLRPLAPLEVPCALPAAVVLTALAAALLAAGTRDLTTMLPAARTGDRTVAGMSGRSATGTGGHPTAGPGGHQAAGAGGHPTAGPGGHQAAGTGGHPTAETGEHPTTGTGGHPTASPGGHQAAETSEHPTTGTGGHPTASPGGHQAAETSEHPTTGTGEHPPTRAGELPAARAAEVWRVRARRAALVVGAGVLYALPAVFELSHAAGLAVQVLVVAGCLEVARRAAAGPWTALVAALVASAGAALSSTTSDVAPLVVLPLLVALFAAVSRARRPLAAAALPAALVHAALLVCSVAALRDWEASTAGLLLLAVPASAALIASRPWAGRATVPVEVTGVVVAVGALLFTVLDPPALALALTLSGVIAGATALRPGRRPVAHLATVLCVLAAWVRLAAWDVSAPEAYALPAAVPLLALGVVRRRRDASVSSWPAYAPGLAVALLPSLVAAWADPHWTRPLLLGTAALAVTVAGAVRRLQAPLVLGGAVLVLDALHELAPYLVQALGALPRWAPPAAAGLVLLLLGTTYEQRLRDARRAREALRRMG
jgi:hypothetical protein